MATGRITKQTVDATHAGLRDKLVWDAKLPGFGLKVTPAGSKVFIFQYRIGGRGAKVRRYTIGKYGTLTPDKARGEAERLAMMVAQGVDPQNQKAERNRQAIDLAFDKYLKRFDDECLALEWRASQKDVKAMLDRYALPVLKSKPLPDITRADIRDILTPLKRMPAAKAKVFAVLRRLFTWAVSQGDLASSPLTGMEKPAQPASRDRHLEDWEIALVWKASAKLGYPFGPIVRLLLLNGARREEVAALPWEELRQATSLWSLPAARAKNGEGNDLTLSTLAVVEVDQVARRVLETGKWPRKGYLFSTTGETPVSGYSRAKKRLDAQVTKLNNGEPLENWTLHDLRRTLATGMQRLGVRFEVTEAILNHISGARSGVAGVYQRHHWRDEKRTALQAWADHIAMLLNDADQTNVVQLSKAG